MDRTEWTHMEQEFKKTIEILNRLHDMQKHHLDAFDKEVLPDLEKQSEERNIEMEGLMGSVGKFLKSSENTKNMEDMLLILNDHIKILLEQNKALETKVKKFRDDIKKGMNQVSKGKKMIGSYRSSNLILNTPKVISVTN